MAEPLDSEWELIAGMWVKAEWQAGPRSRLWGAFWSELLCDDEPVISTAGDPGEPVPEATGAVTRKSRWQARS